MFLKSYIIWYRLSAGDQTQDSREIERTYQADPDDRSQITYETLRCSAQYDPEQHHRKDQPDRVDASVQETNEIHR